MDNKISSRVVFIKSENKNDSDFTIDAINSYISNLDSCKELKYVEHL